MSLSQFYRTNSHAIADGITTLLSTELDAGNRDAADSPRAVANAMERLVCDRLEAVAFKLYSGVFKPICQTFNG